MLRGLMDGLGGCDAGGNGGEGAASGHCDVMFKESNRGNHSSNTLYSTQHSI